MSKAYDRGADLQDGKRDTVIDLVLGIFFDGTCNNRKNTEAREAWEAANGGKPWDQNDQKNLKNLNSKESKAYQNEGNKDDDSYENDKTNINRGETYYKKDDATIFKIYIEGAATLDLEGDDWWDGNGLGRGRNGIRGKVRKACEEIVKKCKAACDTNGTTFINSITFDVFGFSRGAAQARNFVWEVTTNHGISGVYAYIDDQEYKDELIHSAYKPNIQVAVPLWGFLGHYLKKKGLELRMPPIIRFVGLYDTVSSYDKKYTMVTDGLFKNKFKGKDPDFSDNVNQLHLNAIIGAERVVHITAADEHRKNFALTTTRCMAETIPDNYLTGGRQIEFPGVHCDIGGCYQDEKTERWEPLYIASLENLTRDRLTFIREGWFKEYQVWMDSSGKSLGSNRENLSHKYSYIALHVMTDFGNKKVNKMFDDAQLKKKYKIENPGNATLEYIRGYCRTQLQDEVTVYRKELANYTKARTQQKAGKYVNVPPKPLDLSRRIDRVVVDLLDRWHHNPGLPGFELLWYAYERLTQWVFEGGTPLVFRNAQEVLNLYPVNEKQLSVDALARECGEQVIFRMLRNKFLHWSSHYRNKGKLWRDAYPYEPNPGRIRTKYD